MRASLCVLSFNCRDICRRGTEPALPYDAHEAREAILGGIKTKLPQGRSHQRVSQPLQLSQV